MNSQNHIHMKTKKFNSTDDSGERVSADLFTFRLAKMTDSTRLNGGR